MQVTGDALSGLLLRHEGEVEEQEQLHGVRQVTLFQALAQPALMLQVWRAQVSPFAAAPSCHCWQPILAAQVVC